MISSRKWLALMLVLFCTIGFASAGLGDVLKKILNKTKEIEEEIEEELEAVGITYEAILKNMVWFFVGGVAGIILMLSVWLSYKMMDPKPYSFNQEKIGPLEQKILDERKKTK
uniref:Uncharacterized protein n=1 Tax=Heterosigma akashiwo TaxID=2829 RepID=A0A7S3UVX4_HETAK|mmetsp:Transcript_14513/g.25729  ORF Transcript_14513/g.25729 Transcript_14513/m.25729 type:complete len:113 (-) Transcript_14513:121-459(-)|eukprot:CAMPEP_0194573886 /NCGR_PEP_ID=MMETSP0292-20121207/9948_1 /TAXON_ID=39354 /ORGANISM="Heterosigma akashiwo, Strain CCMP2393" /LENGTH=112 /DNA_ID=CAMNT_0039425277 /DNA_START=35 /DNA_END=373 /DNA_ORIENTATION=+